MIYRTYICDDCDTTFEVCHDSGDEPFPPCPNCEKVLEWCPQRIAIGGSNTSKAVKVAQDIMEKDYGLSNFRDNNREGDVGVIMPSQTKPEIDKIQREVMEMSSQVTTTNPAVQGFWGGPAAQGGQGVNPMVAQTLMASAKVGPQANVDAMAHLHSMGKAGKLPNNFRIVSRVK